MSTSSYKKKKSVRCPVRRVSFQRIIRGMPCWLKWFAGHRSPLCAVSCGVAAMPRRPVAETAASDLVEGAAAAPRSSEVSALLDVMGCRRLIRLTDHEIRVAVVMMRLSGRSDLVLHWVRLQQLKKWRWRPGLAHIVTAEVLQQWCDRFDTDSVVVRCLANPGACVRGTVHIFLVQSVLAERVQDLTRAGLLVPPGFVLGKYVAMLSMLPPCPAVASHRSSLESHAHAAKKWSRRFRQDWNLAWGCPSLPHGISEQAAARRAGVFIRWIRHVLFQRIAPRKAVVVNMDETMLSNVRPWKRGVTAAAGAAHFADTMARDAAMPRTSLMASVCSDDAIQAKLPQIRLPRGRGGKLPSRVVASCYAEAGAPQIAVHGGSGWCTAPTLAWYVRLVARTVRVERPDCVPVLVMDCCPVHLVGQVFAAARKAGVYIILVPARMTWMLQPLDTHVFAVLKARIREATFEAKAASRSARLPYLARVRVHSRAIRQVLVERSWSACMVRAGLTGDTSEARPALATLLAGQSLEPAAPSVADLAELLSMPLPRAEQMHRQLLPPSDLLGAAAAVAPVAVGPGGGEAMPEAGRQDRVAAPIVLSRLMRLPPRPKAMPCGSNVWIPPSHSHRAQTRSMTAASLASTFAAASAAVRPPLPPPLRRLRSSASQA